MDQIETTPGQILIVEDSLADFNDISASLSDSGYRCLHARNQNEACEQVIKNQRVSIILIDWRLPERINGEAVLKCVQESPRAKQLYPIMMSTVTDADQIDDATARGFPDFLVKPAQKVLLLHKLKSAERILVLRKQVAKAKHWSGILGGDSSLLEEVETACAAAKSDAVVLLLGETGVGKEEFARAIHNESERKGAFVAVNVASIPHNLIEDELFGHVKGAFADAKEFRPGKITAADGGTLFLDEIGELPFELQAKLLRVLQFKKYCHLGSEKETTSNFRLISATRANLEQMVQDKSFREDLFHRINLITITIKPLRDRKSDVQVMTDHFLNEMKKRHGKVSIQGFSQDAYEWLQSYNWPGNVREMINKIERAVILAKTTVITKADLIKKEKPTPEMEKLVDSFLHEADLQTDKDFDELFVDLQNQVIKRMLKQSKGNVAEAARRMRIFENTLRERIKAREIDTKIFK